MTELLERAVQTAWSLPADRQDEVARLMLAYAELDEPVIKLTEEEEADLVEARAEMERGEFATDAEVEAVWSKFRS